ncbi:MAG: UDP-glucose 4-epimerase GalE [Propionibacteriaceae bacterium]|nr:UDP-glucose 4-epimerase GalE [Propionibacteriaceae bacterium]
MRILLTGGAGYIGSHVALDLCSTGHEVIIVDNLSNSSRTAIERVEEITGKTIDFHQLDCRDTVGLRHVFHQRAPEGVIHLAGLKSVGESVAQPLTYYDTNINAALSVIEVMDEFDVRKLIFSSSATVYGDPEFLPLTEQARTGVGISNPYGWTKFFIEQILMDLAASNNLWEISLLRYFNPVGAHESGLIGEDPTGIPNNLMPFVAQVAAGRHDQIKVFGDDYDTPDGTGVRDYIHVMDLGAAHRAALEHLRPGVDIYNVGTGTPVSVLEIISGFEQACGRALPYTIKERRAGDLASTYCCPDKAESELNWKAHRTIAEACQDSWRWQSMNPDGYGTPQGN